MDILDLDSLILIYENENGDLFEQNAADIAQQGIWKDDDGQELELVGWRKDS